MKVPEIEKTNDDGSVVYARHDKDGDGFVKGEPIMRDETRDETLGRLRAKYLAQSLGSDAFAANNAREMLDVLDLIAGSGGASPDLSQLASKSDLDKLSERVDKLETRG